MNKQDELLQWVFRIIAESHFNDHKLGRDYCNSFRMDRVLGDRIANHIQNINPEYYHKLKRELTYIHHGKIPSPEDIGIEKSSIEPRSRKLDIGKMGVCTVCGQHQDGLCHDGKTEPLKDYYERVHGKPFVREEWSMEVKDNLTNYHGIDLDQEMVDIITNEINKKEIGLDEE